MIKLIKKFFFGIYYKRTYYKMLDIKKCEDKKNNNVSTYKEILESLEIYIRSMNKEKRIIKKKEFSFMSELVKPILNTNFLTLMLSIIIPLSTIIYGINVNLNTLIISQELQNINYVRERLEDNQREIKLISFKLENNIYENEKDINELKNTKKILEDENESYKESGINSRESAVNTIDDFAEMIINGKGSVGWTMFFLPAGIGFLYIWALFNYQIEINKKALYLAGIRIIDDIEKEEEKRKIEEENKIKKVDYQLIKEMSMPLIGIIVSRIVGNGLIGKMFKKK